MPGPGITSEQLTVTPPPGGAAVDKAARTAQILKDAAIKAGASPTQAAVAGAEAATHSTGGTKHNAAED